MCPFIRTESGLAYTSTEVAHSTSIVCTFLEPTSLAAMVGVPVLITCRINRPGTVTLSGLGTATITADGSSYLASYLFTPSSAGSLPITITATDSGNGTTSSVSITLVVAAAAVLPAVTPLARMQHDAPAFQDLGGTVAATAPHALVRRVNNVSPLTGYWQSSPAAYKDVAGFRIEPADPNSGAYPLQFLSSPGSGINLNNSTFVCSWVQRWNEFTLLLCTGANPQWGVTTPPLSAFVNGAQSALGSLATLAGARHTLIVRWGGTDCKAKLLINGVLAGTATITTTINSGHPGADELRVGHFQSFAYGTIVEMLVINSAVNDTVADQLLAYADSIPCRPAFPVDQILLAATGDSNTVGVGTSQYSTPKFSVPRALRSTLNLEMLCTAKVGWPVTDHADFIAPYYDSRRKVHIASCAAGTNNLANNNDTATTITQYFATLDQMRAQGWRVIGATIQDRNGMFAGGATHASYRTAVDTFNAAIRAGTSHYDALLDIAAIPQLGADGAADNLSYFSSDKIHFNDAGQSLLQAPYLAAVQACYALAA